MYSAYRSNEDFVKLFPAFEKTFPPRDRHQYQVVGVGEDRKLDYVPCDKKNDTNSRIKEVCEFLFHYMNEIPKSEKHLQFVRYIRRLGLEHNLTAKLKHKIETSLLDGLLYPASDATCMIGNSSGVGTSKILSFALENKQRGYAAVLLAPGNNDPDRRLKYLKIEEKVKDVFDHFEAEFESVTEAKKAFDYAISEISTCPTFITTDKEKYIADATMCLAQLVFIQGKKHLVYAQSGACTLALGRQDGVLCIKPSKKAIHLEAMIGSVAEVREVTSGDLIYLFTEAVGSYLTEEEFRSTLKNQMKNPKQIARSLHSLIVSFEGKAEERRNLPSLSGEPMQCFVKDPQSNHNYGIAYLVVS